MVGTGVREKRDLAVDGGRLHDRVAVLTGGASGLGAAIGDALVQAGASVVVLDASPSVNRSKNLPNTEVNPMAVRVDVRDSAAIAEAVGLAVRRFGKVDILVNNAGVATSAPVVDMSEDEWNLVLDVNLKGTFLMTRALLPHMLERRSGAIINVSSREGKRGVPLIAHYCAAKAAVINFTRAVALEAAPDVRVNCVCPGIVDTPMVRETLAAQARRLNRAMASLEAEWISQIPLGQMQSAEAIARAVLFLASDDAAEITGQALSVDGGSVMA